MAGKTTTNPTDALITLPQLMPPKAFIIFPIAGESMLNPTPIKMAVSDCVIEIGDIFFIIQEDIVIPAAIKTREAETIAASFKLIFNAATFSKAIATNIIPMDSPTTERKFIPPTSLKATPMAKTATAINNIVPTPFLILLSFLGSPPALSNSLFLLLPDDFLESCIIVSWFLSIFLLSD